MDKEKKCVEVISIRVNKDQLDLLEDFVKSWTDADGIQPYKRGDSLAVKLKNVLLSTCVYGNEDF